MTVDGRTCPFKPSIDAIVHLYRLHQPLKFSCWDATSSLTQWENQGERTRLPACHQRRCVNCAPSPRYKYTLEVLSVGEQWSEHVLWPNQVRSNSRRYAVWCRLEKHESAKLLNVKKWPALKYVKRCALLSPISIQTQALALASWRLRLMREIFTQQTQAPANRNARSKQWQP